MRILLSFFLFFSTQVFANIECTEAIDDAKLFCKSSVDQCADLHECLVRKDTCVDKEPKNEIECNNLDDCSDQFRAKFDARFNKNNTKCEYKWHVPSSGNAMCMVEGHFLFSEEACPGRTSGLLNAVAYGLSSAVDKFDCKGVRKKYQEKTESCVKAMKKVAAICPDIPQSLVKYKNVKCRYSEKFASFNSRQFSLDNGNSSRVNQIPRNGDEYRPPHGDGGAGGSGSGGDASGQ